MTLLEFSQIVGTAAIFLLFVIKFYIAVTLKHFLRSGRVAILWTTIYVFFLFVLRLLGLFGIGSIDDLRIISGFSAIIPLIGVLSHLYLSRNMDVTGPSWD